ncbi:hypothetical protein O7632_20160 [Solwaraspora sp. WMMD406]|uniref:hypothetical protein n=1 Tax=Solwaraspora sp. WMMD406 TaxID=3016095 RepID=UPI002416FAE5|nr:hypothetical protein [Solwaraspora sp. WMMD406]MDG4766398.1 hypothetical protein [Solwaraspora sp. WMMD406]
MGTALVGPWATAFAGDRAVVGCWRIAAVRAEPSGTTLAGAPAVTTGTTVGTVRPVGAVPALWPAAFAPARRTVPATCPLGPSRPVVILPSWVHDYILPDATRPHDSGRTQLRAASPQGAALNC